MTPELRDLARDAMLAELAQGFDGEAAIVERVVGKLADDLDDAEADELTAAAAAIFDEALDELEREQATWPELTDCDRLDAAFDDLNDRGILARHHWWCCSTCGHRAMSDEYERVAAVGVDPRGYAFYHLQDTEHAADGGGLHLAYGAFADGAPAAVAIAGEVTEVLAANGLEPTWNGSVEQRITVPLRWQRRARPPRWTED